jgi:hypothetical protein
MKNARPPGGFPPRVWTWVVPGYQWRNKYWCATDVSHISGAAHLGAPLLSFSSFEFFLAEFKTSNNSIFPLDFEDSKNR